MVGGYCFVLLGISPCLCASVHNQYTILYMCWHWYTYGDVTSLLNNVTYINYDIISISDRIQNYYIEQGAKIFYYETIKK